MSEIQMLMKTGSFNCVTVVNVVFSLTKRGGGAEVSTSKVQSVLESYLVSCFCDVLMNKSDKCQCKKKSKHLEILIDTKAIVSSHHLADELKCYSNGDVVHAKCDKKKS